MDVKRKLQTGEKLEELTPSTGGWIEVSIPKITIESKTISGNYLAFMIKLSSESIETNNFYTFSIYECAVDHNDDKPYLIEV